MHYGIQIKLDDGTDLVSAITPMFILDYIENVPAGARHYSLIEGLRLKVMINSCQTHRSHGVTVSGNSVSWKDYCYSPIIVYME